LSPPLDAGRRAALLGVKLRALVSGDSGAAGTGEAADIVDFAGGAALRTPDATWVLVESAAVGLGAVLAWAGRDRPGGSAAPHVVVDGDAAPRAGALARQAALFAPAPTLWRARGRRLDAVVAEARPEPPAPHPAALGRIDELRAAGLDVVVEHGTVRGEIEGLEVAVVAVDDQGGARIEVGVGRNDREAFALLHGDLAPASALRQVADTVRRHRRAGAPAHPLNRLAAARWLRARLLADRLAGWSLDPVAAVVPRSGVADDGPAFAYGRDGAGAPVVLACSVGVDLELVPAAADARDGLDPGARLVLAVPARDAHPVTRRLAAALRRPAEILAVDGDWRR
jgi:hypothetical protein